VIKKVYSVNVPSQSLLLIYYKNQTNAKLMKIKGKAKSLWSASTATESSKALKRLVVTLERSTKTRAKNTFKK